MLKQFSQRIYFLKNLRFHLLGTFLSNIWPNCLGNFLWVFTFQRSNCIVKIDLYVGLKQFLHVTMLHF